MGTGHVVAVRTRHQARPGRRAIVVTDLASLKGPTHGIVELPLRLYWSSLDRTFDLDKPFMQRWMYQIVLREAALPDELTTYLNAGLLAAMWRDLVLPRGVRWAWEEHHPALRAAAGAVGSWIRDLAPLPDPGPERLTSADASAVAPSS